MSDQAPEEETAQVQMEQMDDQEVELQQLEDPMDALEDAPDIEEQQ